MDGVGVDACEAAAPYTLLGLLLRGGVCSSYAADPRRFLRDYAHRGANAYLWISLVAVTFLLLRRFAAIVRFWTLGSRIPGPPCSPFFSSSELAAACGSGAGLTDYLSKSHRHYGPIVRLWLGPSQLLVSVKEPALIKEMLIKAEDRLPLTGRAYHLAFGRLSLFVSSVEKVKKGREYMAEYLKHKLTMGAKRSPFQIIETIMERVESTMSRGLLDCYSFSQHIAFYVLARTLFGDVFLDWPDATTYEELLMMIAKDGCFWAFYTIPPYWETGYWRYRSLCTRLKHLTQDIIQLSLSKSSLSGQDDQNSYEHTEAASIFDDINSGSLLQREAGRDFCLKELCGNISGLMLHGCLMTTSLINSILTRLVSCPRLQEQIYSEISSVQKGFCKLFTDDVQKMQYLLAVVYESARLLPAGSFLQRCSLKQDLRLKSSTIPAGAVLVAPLQLVHMDASIWGEDAHQFNPNRFLPNTTSVKGILDAHESNGSPLLSKLDEIESFLAFGSGTRACLGQKFAVIGVATLIASLLQNYEIRLQPAASKEVEPTTIRDCGLHALHNLPSPKIVFVKRNN